MSTLFHELRITFAWTETTPALLSWEAAGAPMAFLASAGPYQVRWTKMIERLKAIVSKVTPVEPSMDGRELEPPWRWRNLGRRYRDRFWYYYLGNRNPLTVHPATIWSRVTPFRQNFRISKIVSWGNQKPTCGAAGHGLYYPHGYAALITLYLRFPGGEELDSMMFYALDSVKAGFSLKGAQNDLDTEGMRDTLLEILREQALGGAAPSDQLTTNPLITTTVIRGNGYDADTAIVPGTQLHKALEGLCRWRDGWSQNTNLTDPARANLLVRPDWAGHMVYHTPRGRAVWMPNYLSSTGSYWEHRLSCYHNNLVNVTLQTDMLARLVTLFMGTPQPSEDFRALARLACERLVDLYASAVTLGSKPTYNSASPRAYLTENGFLEPLQQACQSFDPPVPQPTYALW